MPKINIIEERNEDSEVSSLAEEEEGLTPGRQLGLPQSNSNYQRNEKSEVKKSVGTS